MLAARRVPIYLCYFCTASVASCSTPSAYAKAVLLLVPTSCAHNFQVNGGNFIDIRGGQIQYNMNAMSITGNNNRAEMNPVFNSGDPSTAYTAPRYGPSQSNTSTYPGYTQTNSPHTNPSYANTAPPHTNSPPPDPPYNPAVYSAAEQQHMYYNYQASQFVQAQYQPGQQAYPYSPQSGQQPHPHSSRPGQQSYRHPSQSGQSHYHPSQSGQSYPPPSQPEHQPYRSPPEHEHQQYHYPPQQQSTTTIHQYQQVFQNTTVDAQHHRSSTPPSTADSEDPDVTEIRENLARQDLS